MADPSKTEQATPKRRSEARGRGQVAKSTEVNSLLILLSVLLTIRFTGTHLLWSMENFLRRFLGGAPIDWTPATALAIFNKLLLEILLILIPIMVAALLAGLAANLGQVGFLFTGAPLKPDLNRLNPIPGFSRLVSRRGFIELIKSLAKIALTGLVAFVTLKGQFPSLLTLTQKDLGAGLFQLSGLAYTLSLRILIVLLIIAILDYFYQRYDFEEGLKMTREEVRDEMKQAEGDPHTRGRQRARMRQIAMRRMIAAVPEAQVVVTNPVHLAVAMKYTEEMDAPTLVAKGAGAIAEKIKQIARDHQIPVLENKEVARALFKNVEVGDSIPPDLYRAVAEIIAFLYRGNKVSTS
ncbi:MAG: flagellar biosynthesis protein FlhB [Armatimonadetes bacterium]|nr:flagellar biosynthesis protein FlhB [Armatimonadota bacterium]